MVTTGISGPVQWDRIGVLFPSVRTFLFFKKKIYRDEYMHMCFFFQKKSTFLELKYQLCDYFVRIKRAALFKVNKTYGVCNITVMAHV